MDRDPHLEHLVTVVQMLSLARTLDDVMQIVRRAARRLTGADGATFVLREHDLCYYADEDAIAPLWKGRRFPIDICISGWVMLNRQPAVIEDVYADARIPADVYLPTFVKSLVMVPIRTMAPLGAIGTYWAKRRQAGPQEVHLLQALADTTAVALENVLSHKKLEQGVQNWPELQEANVELSTALDRVGNPEQIIRMCAWTRRLKLNDEWLSVEDFLQRRFGLQVSHGISEEAMETEISKFSTDT
jgi:GAF domain-containing protein